jgi:hypothetical protein
MDEPTELDPESVREASVEQIELLLHDHREPVLLTLLENPRLQELQLCVLLSRKELSTHFLETVAGNQQRMTSSRVRRALAFHHNLPLTLGLKLVRELFLPDLVQLALSPSAQPALRHLAEELVIKRVPQLPTAQKLAIARHGSVRIMGALLTDGSPEILPTVLDSPFLNEGHVLRTLSRVSLPVRIVTAIADHSRWSHIPSVRLALLRNPQTPLARALSFLPSIPTTDLQALVQSSSVPSHLQPHVRRELNNRALRGKATGRIR